MSDIIFIWLIHFIELVLVGLLLWRVETLPTLSLTPGPSPRGEGSDYSQGENSGEELSTPLHYREEQGGGAVNIDLAQIERQLAEHCVATQLYLKHDLTLQQLAQAIGIICASTTSSNATRNCPQPDSPSSPSSWLRRAASAATEPSAAPSCSAPDKASPHGCTK